MAKGQQRTNKEAKKPKKDTSTEAGLDRRFVGADHDRGSGSQQEEEVGAVEPATMRTRAPCSATTCPARSLQDLAKFLAPVDFDFSSGNHRLGRATTLRKAACLEERIERDEVAAKFEVELLHGDEADCGWLAMCPLHDNAPCALGIRSGVLARWFRSL